MKFNSDSDNISTFMQYCIDNNITPIKSDQLALKPTNSRNDQLRPNLTKEHKSNFNSNDASTSLLFNDIAVANQFYREGQKNIVKHLFQGKYKVIATLDLHNYTQSRTLSTLEQFISSHSTPGSTCIKVIHGKGLNSENNIAILKNLVRRYLSNNAQVLAFSYGNPCLGGDGVTLVKLKATIEN